MDALIGQHIGQYEIVALLGKGGMATVYRAQQLSVRRDVAIKVIRPELISQSGFLERFEREAQIVASLSHPHILKVFDYGKQGDVIYLVTELLSGGSIADLLAKGPLPPVRTGELLSQIGMALDYAHRRDVIHRDLKPANVLLDQDGNAILTDFGLARLVSDDARLTATGITIGTPAYMPPEQWMGLDTDALSDLYSLGLILFEMLTGVLPFDAPTTAGLMNAHLNQPPPLHLLPAGLEALKPVIAQAMAKNPEQRYQTANAMSTAFQEALRQTHAAIVVPTVIIAQSAKVPTAPLTPTAPPTVITATPTRAASQATAVRLGIGLIALLIILALIGAGLALARRATSTPVIQVTPVAADEYMVLVTQPQQLDAQPREVTRFVVNDLQQKLEAGIPFSKIRIREYPQVITSEADALAAAQANNAVVVIWGDASANLIELHIQAGVLNDHIVSAEVIRRSVDVQVRLTDPRQQSVAVPVVAALARLQQADNNIETLRSIVILNELKNSTDGAESVGDTTAARLNRIVLVYVKDPKDFISQVQPVIDQDAANPLLYLNRAQAYVFLNQLDAAKRDLDTAQRLVTGHWIFIDYLNADIALISGNVDESLSLIKGVAEAEPKDWFAAHYTGLMYYLKGDYVNTKKYVDQAIKLSPNAGFPYLLGTLLALHEGRINDALFLINTDLTLFPDPSFGNQFVQAAFGVNDPTILSRLFAAGGKLLIGQYDSVVTDAQTGEKISPNFADWYFMEGFAQCNLGKYDESETALSKGLDLDPKFTLLHLIRASVRLKQNKFIDAAADVAAVNEDPQASAELKQLMAQGMNGTITCQNILTAKSS